MMQPLDDWTTQTARSIIERCVFENDEFAWAMFLARYGDLIRRSFLSSDPGLSYEEFGDWFPGWFFEQRKLHALYRALLAKITRGECSTCEGEEVYVRNYLVDVVRSAVGDWFRQHRPPPPHPRPPSDTPSEVEFAESIDRLRRLIVRLDRDLRLPFWLRHRQALGPLLEVDAEWIARSLGWADGEVERAIARELGAQLNPDRPLASRFIGQLLGLPPLSNGKYAAVDQRIRRARILIRKFVQDEDGSCSN